MYISLSNPNDREYEQCRLTAYLIAGHNLKESFGPRLSDAVLQPMVYPESQGGNIFIVQTGMGFVTSTIDQAGSIHIV